MSARSFFDTNVLVYADDDDAPAKQRRARDLVYEHRRNGTGVVSLQVLQEYFVTVTRKLKLNSQIARRKVELLAEFDVAVPPSSRHTRRNRLPPPTCIFFLGGPRPPHCPTSRLQRPAIGRLPTWPRNLRHRDRKSLQ
jgi:hypothetical protein